MKNAEDGIVYTVVEENKDCDDYGSVVSYGISASQGESKLDEVDDISLDREKIKKLAELFNELELSIVHFRDVLEDMLP